MTYKIVQHKGKLEKIFQIGELIPFKLKWKGNNVTLPAVILNTSKTDDNFPVYDIGFWMEWNDGSTSGMINLQKQCIWRYVDYENSYIIKDFIKVMVKDSFNFDSDLICYKIRNEFDNAIYEYPFVK